MWSNSKNGRQHSYETLISNKTKIEGDISFSGGLHIDGHVKGSIFAADDKQAVVRVSNQGVVEGEVRAPNIIINGEVKGDIHCSEHLELAANASITGTVHYQLLEMVMGAQVNGRLIHQDANASAVERAESPTPTLQSVGSGSASAADGK